MIKCLNKVVIQGYIVIWIKLRFCVTQKAKIQDKYLCQARIKSDVLPISSPNPTRKARPDL